MPGGCVMDVTGPSDMDRDLRKYSAILAPITCRHSL